MILHETLRAGQGSSSVCVGGVGVGCGEGV